MRLDRIVVIGLLSACVGSGQVYTSPPPICFSFNDLPPSGLLPSVSTGVLTAHFVCPATSVIERVDLSSYPFFGMNFAIEIFATSSLGVPPSGPPLATFALFSLFGAAGWAPSTIASIPASVTAGSTYAVRITGMPSFGSPSPCWALFHDPMGPQQLPYQFLDPYFCSPNTPSAGQIGMMIRFRGYSCGPGPPASVQPIGAACGLSVSPALLASMMPPVLGLTNWQCSLYSPNAGEAAYLYWSGGVNVTGSPITATSPCLYYLDAQSLYTLALLGAEPLAAGIVPPTAYISWSFPVPANPIYAGLVIGAQAIVIGPSGTIPLGGGVFAHTSNALQLVLGY